MPSVDPDSARERMWEQESRFSRRAEVVAVDRLTITGTVRIAARVTDDGPFHYEPGQFVAIQEDVPSAGLQHSPYCLLDPPTQGRDFRMLIRVFPEGPLSHYLASMRPGTPLHFRGPLGKSMVPRETAETLVLLGTGVGLSPLHSLVAHLLRSGDRRPMRLYWGVRLVEDICMTDELDALAAAHPNFRYDISLSQPSQSWTGLRGRLTESVPPQLDHLADTAFFLAGNGAMAEEMETALSGMGVDRKFIHQERFFNVRHHAEPAIVKAILERFVAHDLFAPHIEQQTPTLFPMERDVHGRKLGG